MFLHSRIALFTPYNSHQSQLVKQTQLCQLHLPEVSVRRGVKELVFAILAVALEVQQHFQLNSIIFLSSEERDISYLNDSMAELLSGSCKSNTECVKLRFVFLSQPNFDNLDLEAFLLLTTRNCRDTCICHLFSKFPTSNTENIHTMDFPSWYY